MTKRFLHKTFIALAFTGLSAGAFAYDFSAVNNGQTIYYNITSSTAPMTVDVTYETLSSNSYSGSVEIPVAVSHNGNSYSVTGIGNKAFRSCLLTSVTIPNSVTIIGNEAFSYCVQLTSVTVPNSVTMIGGAAFFYCGLTSVTVPNSVATIGDIAFSNCGRLTGIDVEANNSYYSSVGGVLFNKTKTVLIQYPGSKTGSYAVPNSVITIGDRAFAYCSSLTSVTIPNSVTEIENYAFRECSHLTSIDVEESNSYYSSVSGVLFNKLQDRLIQCPIAKTGNYTIGNLVTTIGDMAFAYCSGLTSVTIGNSVTTIENNAFNNCNGLTGLYVKVQTPPALGNDVFTNVSSAIPVHVLCGKLNAYQSATGWNSFKNYIGDIPFAITVQSNNIAMGTASIIKSNSSCTDNTAIIKAVSNQGYRFVKWNDNNTENPRTIAVTQDAVFMAMFDVVTQP